MAAREKDIVGLVIAAIIAAALIFGVVACNQAFGCGGMTQIDPPSLDLQIGPTDSPPESILNDVDDFMVIC